MTALLEVSHVSKRFVMGGQLSRGHVDAVIDANLSLSSDASEIFTIIGESGSGKTTLARMILGLEHPTSGDILFEGKSNAERRTRAARRDFLRRVQPVFQNPFETFNPLKRVDRYLYSTARRLFGARTRSAAEAAMDDALHKVGLSLREVSRRYAHELSGGQLQRVAIARALIPNPSLLIADEPVSMVDASLRMSIVNLLRDLRDQFGVSVIYITHDLATAYYISDRLAIMQRGYTVEMGPARPILDAPEHPYSRLLKESVLSVDDATTDELLPADRSEAMAAWERAGGGHSRNGRMAASSGCRAGSASGRSEAHHRPRDRRQRNPDLAVDVRRWQRQARAETRSGSAAVLLAWRSASASWRQSTAATWAPSGRVSTVNCTVASSERLTTNSTAPASSRVATASTSGTSPNRSVS